MKILGLQIENFKRLKLVNIVPQDNVVVISGANMQGKTTVMDAFWAALGGAKADKAQGTIEPIREGQKKASVIVTMEGIKVTRKWTSNDKSILTVENQQGAKFKSPQAMLDKLVGSLSFDPMVFSEMEGKQQLDTMLSLVKFSEDPKELDRQKKDLYDERTIVNRQVTKLEAQLAGMIVPGEDTPTEETVATDILVKMQAASEQLTANNLKRQDLQSLGFKMNQLKGDIKSIDDEMEMLLEKIDTLKGERAVKQESLDDVITKGKALQVDVKELKDTDIAGLQEQMNNIEQDNKAFRDAVSYREKEKELTTAKEESQAFTNKIKAIEDKKEAILKEAKFPVDGLGFTETGVTLNGIPFSQCSSREKLIVSLSIAMALNPELRVIRMNNGNMLDSSGMAILQQMAAEKDYQVWLEMVDETGSMGVYIEDGEVVTMPTIAAVKTEPEKVKKAKTVDEVLASLDKDVLF